MTLCPRAFLSASPENGRKVEHEIHLPGEDRLGVAAEGVRWDGPAKSSHFPSRNGIQESVTTINREDVFRIGCREFGENGA